MSLEAALKQSLGYAAVRSVGRRGHGDTASGSAFEVTDDAGNKSTVYVKSSSQQGAKKMFEGEYASLEAMERTGTNCIKIGLPGKSILRDYCQENRTSRRPENRDRPKAVSA